MLITGVKIWPCVQSLKDQEWKFSRSKISQIFGNILELTDDEGNSGFGYLHAIPAISTVHGAALAALEWMVPLLQERPIESLAETLVEIDKAIAGNTTAKVAIDMALHDLMSRRHQVSLTTLLGGVHRKRIKQARLLALKSPADMATNAARVVQEGFGTIKLKFSGDEAQDIERIREVRSAVGSAVVITVDPNQAYTSKGFIRAFSRMDKYDIALVEQPVPAADWSGLALITRALPVDIEADESAQTVEDVFKLVSERAVDVVNIKLTKIGGFRNFMRAAQICEAGGIDCRVGAMFGPSLVQAAGVHAACLLRSDRHASELSEHLHLDNDPFQALNVENGYIELPAGHGIGMGLQTTQPVETA
ncbi:mandelate racemase/muconate lactonizing enzyme family protein [Ottowia thiooxydans]|uniref:mandelate racemase/muconate lactonizing enzyme family protein n=1 Tax=Ottowia thiooxydans TaxID=219182 RepID=UPI000425FA25|nr:enolase C-terminal domain-like protein [Ottowia thiooxydans]